MPTSAGGALKLTNGDLTYSTQAALSQPNGSVTDTFTYTVTDERGRHRDRHRKCEGRQSRSRSDCWCRRGDSVNVGKTVDLTAAILAQVKPGLIGDTETITTVNTASQGVLKLTNGDLTYAPNKQSLSQPMAR